MNGPFTFKDQETLYTDMEQLRDSEETSNDDYSNKNKEDLIKEIQQLKAKQNNSDFYNSSNPVSRHNMYNINKLQSSDGNIYGDNKTADFLNSSVFIECVNAIIKKDDDDDDKFINFFKTNRI